MATTISSGTNPYKLGSPPDFGTLYSGRALEFDGVTDYVVIGNNDSIRPLNTVTIACWINCSLSSGWHTILGHADDFGDYIWLNVHSDGYVSAQINKSSTLAYGTFKAELVIIANTWQRVVMTYDSSSGGVLYVDGVSRETESATGAIDNDTGNLQLGMSATSSYAFDGKMTNFQMWDKVWSESDVQYDYTHPEKLITDNSAVTSGTTISNIKAWYPCTEGNPRSPQTTVYDGSPKGLGSEMMDTGESTYETGTGSWSTVGTNTVTNVDGQVVITYGDTSNNASLNYLTVDQATTINTVDGKVYRLQIDAKYGGTPDAGVPTMKLRNEEGDQSWNLSTTMTTYVRYFTDMAGGAPYLAPQNMAGTGTTVTVDNISLKEVQMGNHGTTTFTGNELITEVNNREFTADSGIDWVALGSGATVAVDVADANLMLVGTSASEIVQGAELPIANVDGATGTESVEADRTYTVTATLDSAGADQTVYFKLGGTATSGFTFTNVATPYSEEIVTTNNTGALQIYTNNSSGLGFTVDDVSVKEKGVATGWTTADAEPLIPQTALMGYSKPLYFNGNALNTYVDCGNLDVAYKTYSCWIKTDSTTTGFALAHTYNSANTRFGFNIYNDKIRGQIYASGGYNLIDYTITPTDVGLIHLVWTWNGSSKSSSEMYVNGTATGPSSSGGSLHGTQKFIIGANTEPSNYGYGLINEVSTFTTELSLAQVQELFNDGVPFDLDGSSLTGSPTLVNYWRNTGLSTWTDLEGSDNGTVTNGSDTILLPEGTTSGKDILGFPLTHTNNGWLNLGENEYVNCGSSSVLNPSMITISAWIYPEILDDYRYVVNRGDDHEGAYRFEIGASNIYVAFGDTSDASAVSGAHGMSVNNWYHIAVTYNMTTAIAYVNTVSKGTASITRIMDTTVNDTTIGKANAEGGNDFVGMIDEVKIYNRALSPTEITKNYKHGLSKHS